MDLVVQPNLSKTSSPISQYAQDKNKIIEAFDQDPHGFFDIEIGRNAKKAFAILSALQRDDKTLLPEGTTNFDFIFESEQRRQTALDAVRRLILDIDPYPFFESELGRNLENAITILKLVNSPPEHKDDRTFIFASEQARNVAKRAICYFLGRSYLEDVNRSKDAADYLGIALDLGCIRTIRLLNDRLKDGQNKNELFQYKVVFEEIRKKALAGDAIAACQFGLLIKYNFVQRQEENVHPTWSSAFDFFKRAADLGQPDALCELGKIYLKGDKSSGKEIKADISTAEIYLNQAAQLGSQEAKAILHKMYSKGKGSEAFALAYFENGDINDEADSAYQLSRLYEEGRIVKKNPDIATALLHKAADMDNPAALYQLGISLLTEDSDNALYYLNKAHELGYARATCELGIIYEEGKLVQRNSQYASELFNEASKTDWDFVNHRKGVLYLEHGQEKMAKQFFMDIMDMKNLDPKYAFWLAQDIIDNEETRDKNHNMLHHYLLRAAKGGVEGAWCELGKFYSKIDTGQNYPANPTVTGYKRDLLIDECFKKEIQNTTNEDVRNQALRQLALVRDYRICTYEKKPRFDTPWGEAWDYFRNAGMRMPTEMYFHPAAKDDKYLQYGRWEIEKLTEAANAGYPDAMFRLGHFLIYNDRSTPETKTEGKRYLVQAAEQGDRRAQAQIFGHAQRYHARSKEFFNRFKKRDEDNAIRFYKMALDISNFGSAYFIAQIYESRIGNLFIDEEAKNQAIHFYQLAARQDGPYDFAAKYALAKLGAEELPSEQI